MVSTPHFLFSFRSLLCQCKHATWSGSPYPVSHSASGSSSPAPGGVAAELGYYYPDYSAHSALFANKFVDRQGKSKSKSTAGKNQSSWSPPSLTGCGVISFCKPTIRIMFPSIPCVTLISCFHLHFKSPLFNFWRGYCTFKITFPTFRCSATNLLNINLNSRIVQCSHFRGTRMCELRGDLDTSVAAGRQWSLSLQCLWSLL